MYQMRKACGRGKNARPRKAYAVASDVGAFFARGQRNPHSRSPGISHIEFEYYAAFSPGGRARLRLRLEI